MDQELIYLYHLGSQEAYDLLLKKYKYIIEKYFAVKYRGSHEILQEDYVQIALIAFNKMLDRYRFDMNTKMSTYFSYAIKDAMHSAIRYVRLQKHVPYDKLVSLSEIMQGHVLKDTGHSRSRRDPGRNCHQSKSPWPWPQWRCSGQGPAALREGQVLKHAC